ncbi:MAG: aminotransferase class I/II-fold pyridoxal phosphate-dependent enzyme [Deltaproteobacteria bacterium]|nr:aminotransferase class I/II-fold pyridoxal phosphate-dependent enzyme [Deltaproteobacteria bacterium]MBW1930860.1 aminotransferase class I/II-fold pyridoxal phosphate-dependent enzyme [Deltaproteobacteria bacterium]MBW2025601.1 aminotransferase class I/II-fold pyridoxal phosphate-dependent enzyme [Deltaproteobacteria bacterium]
MNSIAKELNETIKDSNVHIYQMLSHVGKSLFFPKGILSQSAEAKEKAHRFNATIGMATENGRTMHLKPIMSKIAGLEPEQALTYAPSFGIMPLREAWRTSLYKKNPSLSEKEISLPIVTSGVTHALSVVADMWIDPGDIVVLPDKMWGNYNLIFSVRRGAQIVHYPLFDSGGRFNLEGFKHVLESEAQENGKVTTILNFPNNPTGYTITPDEGKAMVEILTDIASRGINVLAVTDEAYFGLFFEDNVLKESLFSQLVGVDPRIVAIKLDGATKEDYVWGLRVGFITYGCWAKGPVRPIYDALEKKTAGCVRGSISNASHLSQEIILSAMQDPAYEQEKKAKFQIMMDRAAEIKRVLANPKYAEAWDPYPFNSGYFMCLRLKTVEAEPLRTHLLNEYGVGLISLGKTDLRVAFSCIEKEDIQALFDIIFQGVKDLEAK